jgi:hypothetical protein
VTAAARARPPHLPRGLSVLMSTSNSIVPHGASATAAAIGVIGSG